MRQRTGRVAMLAVALTVLLAIASPVGAAVYSDPQGQYTFTVPDGFQQQTDPTGAIFFQTGTAGTNGAIFFINVGTTKIANAGDLVVPQPIGANNTPIPLVADQDATLGGQPGHRFDFSDPNAPGAAPYYIFVTASKDLTPYSVVFVTSKTHTSDFASQLQTIITSFAFGGTPNAASSG